MRRSVLAAGVVLAGVLGIAGDPSADITATRAVVRVYRNGVRTR